jgi:hypothetical protein
LLGDIIVGLSAPKQNGPLSSPAAVVRGLLPANQPVSLSVLRGGALLRVDVTPAP